MPERFDTALGCGIPAVMLAAVTAHSTHGRQTPFSLVDAYEPIPAHLAPRDVLSTLQPVVRRYTFDAQDTGPNALPPHFYRYVAPGAGFPPFGEMRLALDLGYRAEHAPEGPTGALVFDLAGGSMSARIGTSVIPVLPHADYIVACRVRTDDLVHARARLVAWLCDKSGQPIPESRTLSRATDTAGAWQTLSLEMRGTFADAADLVFELQLVQPDIASSAGVRDQPLFQDVRGQARFDDVTISHLPRVTLAMAQPGRLLHAGDPVRLLTQVSELTADRLSARLRIVDIDGRMMHDDAIPEQRGDEPSIVTAANLRCGWYRAILEVAGRDGLVRLRWLDFVILPSDTRHDDHENPFGIAFKKLPAAARLSDALALIEPLAPGLVIAPAWDQDLRLIDGRERFDQRREVIERLSRNGRDLVFRLDDVPAELAAQLPAGNHTALDALLAEPRLWRPYLDDVLTHFGLTTNRWLIGSGDDMPLSGTANALREAGAARIALAEFVPDPKLHVTWPVHEAPFDSASRQAVAIHIPASLPPHAIGEGLAPWVAAGTTPLIDLQTAPMTRHSPRQHLADATLRGLYAWRTGASPLVFAAPWRDDPNDPAALLPAPEYAAWRTLGAHLRGRRFVSELQLGPDVHAWIARGERPGDAALIAWIDRERHLSSSTSIEVQLNDHPVTAIDVFGNASTVVPLNGLHRLDLTDLPIFVEGISPELVMFRGGVAIEPSFVPASSKAHERELVLRNPWDAAVSGRVRLMSGPELELHPEVLEFNVAAHGEARLPLQIIPKRGILAGRKAIAAEITLSADRPHSMRTTLDLEVGLRDLDVNTTWSAVPGVSGPGDVLITATITSRASHLMNLDIDLLAESVPQLRKTIAGLEPGQTQTRTFRVSNGLALLHGRAIRLSVAERDGITRLNQLVRIGEPASDRVEAVPDDGPR